MNVKDLFRGIIVVIDDQVKEENSEIGKIISTLSKDNFPIVIYNCIPDEKAISHLSSASIVILDWDFNKTQLSGEDLTIGEISRMKGLESVNADAVISFIRKLLDEIFVPIFIFTNKPVDDVKSSLTEKNLQNEIENRIFIKQKNDLQDEQLYNEIDNWLKQNPSAYVVKEWDKIAIENRNKMFLDLYRSKVDWVPILWKALSNDTSGLNTQNELGEFITKNFCNRFHSYNFNEDYVKKEETKADELFKILRYDAYMEYSDLNKPNIAYTGDIIKSTKGEYLLNIRAQCDISRTNSQDKTYNPTLYCIKGKKKNSDTYVINNHVVINDDETISIGNDPPISREEVFKNPKTYNDKINSAIKNKFCFKNGNLLERQNCAIFPFVLEDAIIEFSVNEIIQVKYLDEKENIIGRILPPYLNRIQQKVANYIIRQGIMPIPDELFN